VKIHILSDLHLECGKWPRKVNVNEIEADVMVLAGDIGEGLSGAQWALNTFERPVVLLNGNHEFYSNKRTVPEHIAAVRAKCKGTHVHFLENDSAIIDGVRFLGSTMWTDFAVHGDPIRRPRAIDEARRKMNDYRNILADRRPGGYSGRGVIWLTPEHTEQHHAESRAWLEVELARPHGGKTVVVTHHAPSAKSLTYKEPAWLLDAAYASNLEHLTNGSQVSLWIHGHTHIFADYTLNGTRVICNPRGYAPRDTVMEFDPALVIEI
jgi:predicted phosphodiesterase